MAPFETQRVEEEQRKRREFLLDDFLGPSAISAFQMDRQAVPMAEFGQKCRISGRLDSLL